MHKHASYIYYIYIYIYAQYMHNMLKYAKNMQTNYMHIMQKIHMHKYAQTKYAQICTSKYA